MNDKLADEGKNTSGLNTKIQRLENDVKNLKGILSNKVEKESESSSKVTQLEEKIATLEMEKKELDSMLQRELHSYAKLLEEYSLYKQSVKTDMATFKQLKSTFSKIGDLANQGEEILNEPSQTTTVTLTTATHSSETETPLGSVSAGFAQNSGDNSGTIRGGDSISNSIVVNGMVIDDEQAANKLAEGMNSLAQTVESIVNDTGNSAKGSIGTVGAFVQTQTPYQVW